jgi:AcrR family transcriptional regulator
VAATRPARGLTREDWLAAGLGAMADGGARRLAVEPLARTLGATKGSFYWHFRDRDELLGAVLERWEVQETDLVIEGLESLAGPRERLRHLLEDILTRLPARPDPSVALMGDSEERVGQALERVTARRVQFVAEQLEALGIDPDEAARRALLAYTSYLGFATLARSAPAVLPAEDRVARYVETVLELLTSGARTSRG